MQLVCATHSCNSFVQLIHATHSYDFFRSTFHNFIPFLLNVSTFTTSFHATSNYNSKGSMNQKHISVALPVRRRNYFHFSWNCGRAKMFSYPKTCFRKCFLGPNCCVRYLTYLTCTWNKHTHTRTCMEQTHAHTL